ncbi:MAG: hypothetical protein GXP10_07865 [Gammaproteobacteria bacterium]|nr:hypothetical protein [Gammaproteobacteria bacterium]
MDISNLYISNDNLATLDALKNAADGTWINDATVTATLVDATGSPVTGQSWPLALPYVAGTNGRYQGILEDALGLAKKSGYTLKVIAMTGSGLKGYWEKSLRALVRR